MMKTALGFDFAHPPGCDSGIAEHHATYFIDHDDAGREAGTG